MEEFKALRVNPLAENWPKLYFDKGDINGIPLFSLHTEQIEEFRGIISSSMICDFYTVTL